MRIAYFGHRMIALKALEALTSAGKEVVGVVAHPETFEPADPEWTASVRSLAAETGVELQVPEKLDAAFLSTFRGWRVNLLVVVGFLAILRRPLLEIPTLGSINIHAGLLPRYRGRAPLSWAIMNGEREAGLTIHYIDQGVDSGPVIAQRTYPIGETETAGQLYGRIQADIPEFLLEVVERFESGPVEGTPQDGQRAMCFPAISPEHARIDWSRPARRIHDQVRALTSPYPGAWTEFRGQKLTVWKARVLDLDLPDSFPGTVVNRLPGTGVVVSTGAGYLLVEEAQIEGAERDRADRVIRRAGVPLGLEFLR